MITSYHLVDIKKSLLRKMIAQVFDVILHTLDLYKVKFHSTSLNKKEGTLDFAFRIYKY